MKWIYKLICLFKGHDYEYRKWNYNPHSKLFSTTCRRCGAKHFEKDED